MLKEKSRRRKKITSNQSRLNFDIQYIFHLSIMESENCVWILQSVMSTEYSNNTILYRMLSSDINVWRICCLCVCTCGYIMIKAVFKRFRFFVIFLSNMSRLVKLEMIAAVSRFSFQYSFRREVEFFAHLLDYTLINYWVNSLLNIIKVDY